jgi:short-subunit dehydrogenase
MSFQRQETALVTGASTGIGLELARQLAANGYSLVVVARDRDRLAAAATRLRSEYGVAVEDHAVDLSEPGAAEALWADLAKAGVTVDVLVNNAGVGVYGPFLESSPEDWEWLRSINLDGVVHGCRAFGARMVERGHGHVVNVASGAAYIPNRNLAAYCASKAAVYSLSQCLRADWSRHGVGVSVICPGVINTPIAARTRMVGAMAAKQERAVRALGYGHSPQLVAKAIVTAVERNQEIVPVGIESLLAFRVLRFAPGPVQSLVTRVQP